MFHPFHHAKANPDKVAIVMAGSGETTTYRQLDERSNQGAQLFRSLGLKRGDSIALFLENHPRYFEICWAAQRAGLYYTCISSALTAGEVEYIVRDCGAKLFITSKAKAGEAEKLAPKISDLKLFSVDGGWGPYAGFEDARARMPATPIADEAPGVDMLYSSGTTGRPKGVRVELKDEPIDAINSLVQLAAGLFGFNKDTVYLSPAPLYHAAPLRYNMAVHRLGDPDRRRVAEILGPAESRDHHEVGRVEERAVPRMGRDSRFDLTRLEIVVLRGRIDTGDAMVDGLTWFRYVNASLDSAAADAAATLGMNGRG